MSRVVHFEIPATDPEKSMNFYSEVFGWKFTKYGEEDYWFAETGSKEDPGIDGAVMKRRDPNQPVTNAIDVENLDAALTMIEKNGGEVVVPKFPIPTMGWVAYFKDPDGVISGIWQDDPNAA